METGITRQRILSELSRSPHGKLEEYLPIGQEAAATEPNFFAHLIAWDRLNGQVKDAKAALPVIALTALTLDKEFAENALAHFAALGPRELLRAYRFSLSQRVPHRRLRKIVSSWLREKEAHEPKWDRMALVHRKVLHELYALTHTAPNNRADGVLFRRERPQGSVFDILRSLTTMSAKEAAGTILQERLPFLPVYESLRSLMKDKEIEPDLVLALMERMSPNELVANTKRLEKLGINNNPVLRGAFEEKLVKVSGGKQKGSILRTAKAAEAVEDDNLKAKMLGAQERQLSAQKGIEGNWLVLGDKSGSMSAAIEAAKEVAGLLARMVKEKVYLAFFDAVPSLLDVTGLELDVIKKATRHFTAVGATSIGCGLQRIMDDGIEVDGIAIISDAQENRPPFFPDVYERYCAQVGKSVPVYLYRCPATDYGPHRDLAGSMAQAGHHMQEFSLGPSVDYYSLPNLVQTMRTNRYSIMDEIMATPLLTLADVFKVVDTKEKEVTIGA